MCWIILDLFVIISIIASPHDIRVSPPGLMVVEMLAGESLAGGRSRSNRPVAEGCRQILQQSEAQPFRAHSHVFVIKIVNFLLISLSLLLLFHLSKPQGIIFVLCFI